MSADLILSQRGTESAPVPAGMSEITNPIHPSKRVIDRLGNFPSESYDLSAESHLTKLMKVLLGDTGVGQLHKKMILARIQQSIGGTHFFDLDSFYGAVVGVLRRSEEQLSKDPFRESVSESEWSEIVVRDASYRSRVEQFAKALNLGSTAIGMEVAAEAILAVNCDVVENWVTDDNLSSKWATVESIGTYSTLAAYSYAQIEKYGALSGILSPIKDRHKFTIYPHRILTEEERYDATRVLERFRPAGSLIEISPIPSNAYSVVSANSAFSDSEHWKIKTLISNVLVGNQSTSLYDNTDYGSLIEKPIDLWSSYQGESWSLLHTNPSVVAFTSTGSPSINSRFDVTASDLPSQQESVDTGTVTYFPQYALMPLSSIMSGRIVSEGILTSNPYSGTRSTTGTTVEGVSSFASSFKIDGANSDAFSSVNPLNNSSNQHSQLWWESPKRDWYSTESDCVEIRFPSPEFVNYFTIEVGQYPHYMEVQAWLDKEGTWTTLFSNVVRSSSPSFISSKKTYADWSKISKSFDPVFTSVIRIVTKRFGEVGSQNHLISLENKLDALVRISKWPTAVPTYELDKSISAQESYYSDFSYAQLQTLKFQVDALSPSICTPPRAIDKQTSGYKRGLPYAERLQSSALSLAPYQISLRNADVGFRIKSIDDLFVSLTDPNETIATTKNAAGQSIRHFLQTHSASNVFDDLPSYWRSEPLPASDAVVNLYLDLRDSSGALQSVDGFQIDPLTSGPMMNVYWTDSLSEANFASATPMQNNLFPTIAYGNLKVSEDGIVFPTTDTAYLEFSNQNLMMTPSLHSWWFGAEFISSIASNAYGEAILLATSGDSVTIKLSNNSLVFSAGDKSVTLSGLSFPASTRVSVFAKYEIDAVGAVVVSAAAAWNASGNPVVVQNSSASSVPASPPSTPTSLRIGQSFLSASINPMCMTLLRSTISYGDVTATDFLNSPADYTRRQSSFDKFSAGSNLSSTLSGSLMRVDSIHVSKEKDITGSPINIWGVVGGQPNIYSTLVWTPIARDYSLGKGVLRVPNTRAAIWKFEFSSLTAEPIEPFLSVQKLVKFFPNTLTVSSSTSGTVFSNEQQTAIAQSSVNWFTEQLPVRDYTNPYSNKFYPTSGLAYDDPALTALANSRRGFAHNMMAWQPNSIIPVFPSVGTHSYVEQWIEQKNKIAFFVGIRSITPIRYNASSMANDTQYVDHFNDATNIASFPVSTMTFDPGCLYSSNTTASEVLVTKKSATSNVFPSTQQVVAIQFATQQSDPFQIIPDDTFKSPVLPSYDFSSTASWRSTGDAFVFYDQTKSCVGITRDPDAAMFIASSSDPLNKLPDSPITSSIPIFSVSMTPGTFGGLLSPQVSISSAGVLHAACRVFAEKTLDDPLLLQLIGSDGTTVLKQLSITLTPNVVSELTMQYIIGTNPTLEGSVALRIVQQGSTRGAWFVSALSLFDDGCLWEFSNDGGSSWMPAYDVRNNKDGVIRFLNLGNAIRWRFTAFRSNVILSYLQIRPWYFKASGGSKSFPRKGPNASLYDSENPIDQDPDFTSWTNPIPQSWFAKFKKIFTIETERLYGSSTFSSFYNRIASDTISLVDQAGYNAYGAFRGAPESALTMSDSSTRSVTYARSVADTAPIADAAIAAAYSDGMVNPIVDEIP